MDGKKMKHYLAVSFLVVFLYIYDASAAYIYDASSTTCTCGDGSTVKVDEYCLVEGTNNKWSKCQSDGNLSTEPTVSECPKGEFWYNKSQCVKCSDATGNEYATTNGPAFLMYDCYIPKDKTDSDEKGEFTYVAQCYVGCTEETKRYCTSA